MKCDVGEEDDNRQKRDAPAERERQERVYYRRLKDKFEGSGRTQATQFLNVDLDLYATEPLDQLVAAFGKNVLVLEPGTSAGGAYFVPLAQWIAAKAKDGQSAFQWQKDLRAKTLIEEAWKEWGRSSTCTLDRRKLSSLR